MDSHNAWISFWGAGHLDADTLVVSAPNRAPNGAVYVLVFDGTAWQEQDQLIVTDTAALDVNCFGQSLAISGNAVVVGAPCSRVGSRTGAGAAFVFERIGEAWTEQARLLAEDAVALQEFGVSIAIAGGVAVIGAFGDDDYTGAAYVFRRDGNSWAQDAKLVATDGAPYDFFGMGVGISSQTVAVGAPFDIHDAIIDAGSVYVFGWDGTAWTEQAKLTASDAGEGDWFGWAVSIDDETLIAGAFGDDHGGAVNAGSAYVFRGSGALWIEEANLTANDAQDYDSFGASVSIREDIAIAGAHQHDGAGQDAGAAYVFAGGPDCDGNGIVDSLDIAAGNVPDCNGNGVPDACDIDPDDPDGDGIVAPDCNANQVPDECDLTAQTSPDCDANGVPDECDLASGSSDDVNGTGVPDECECIADFTGDGIVGLDDLSILLAHYGSPSPTPSDGDIDRDGDVDLLDLAIMLANFGRACP